MKVSDFLQFMFRLDVSSGQMIRDLQMLRSELASLKQKIVPFNNEEMELLSFHRSDVSKKKGFSLIEKGIFSTIFFEPLVAYCRKTYRNKQMLLLLINTEDEYIYLKKKDKIHVYINNKEIGFIKKGNSLFNTSNQMIGFIEGDDRNLTHLVSIKGRDIGYIANPKMADKNNPRAFRLLQSMDQDESYLFLSLTLINLVEQAR